MKNYFPTLTAGFVGVEVSIYRWMSKIKGAWVDQKSLNIALSIKFVHDLGSYIKYLRSLLRYLHKVLRFNKKQNKTKNAKRVLPGRSYFTLHNCTKNTLRNVVKQINKDRQTEGEDQVLHLNIIFVGPLNYFFIMNKRNLFNFFQLFVQITK